jgi:hypothetical protein
MDANTDPPVLQAELYPVPTEVKGFRHEGIAEQATPTATSTTILPWVRPSALISGVQADVAGFRENFSAAAFYEGKFESLVNDMANIAARSRGPTPMKMADRFTRHNVQRWLRGRNRWRWPN